MRSIERFILSMVVAVLAACGGGGGSDGERDLTVRFVYNGYAFILFEPATVEPGLDGLQGNTPRCVVGSGSLPSGMSLGSNCVLSGTPTAPGRFDATVVLTVAGYRGSVSAALGGDVRTPLLVPRGVDEAGRKIVPVDAGAPLEPRTLVDFTEFRLNPGVSVTYRLAAGVLPAGLALDVATGLLEGTATEIGDFDIQVSARVAHGAQVFDLAAVPLTVRSSLPSLALSYASCCRAAVGVAFEVLPTSNYVPVTGTASAFSVVSGELPPGLALDAATGRISGVPTEQRPLASGIPPAVVRQTVTLPGGGSRTAEAELSFAIDGPLPVYSFNVLALLVPGTTSTDVPAITGGLSGDVYTFSLRPRSGSTANGNAVFGALPAGLTIDPATGRVTASVTAPPPLTAYNFEADVVLVTLRGGGRYESTAYLQYTGPF